MSDLENGHFYLVEERLRGEKGYGIFTENAREGGLVISRCPPDELRKKYNWDNDVESHWLTENVGIGMKDPGDTGKLKQFIVSYIKENPEKPVLLGGIEYLTMQNDFPTILKMIYGINEVVTLEKGIFITTLSPECFSDREVALMRREFGRDIFREEVSE